MHSAEQKFFEADVVRYLTRSTSVLSNIQCDDHFMDLQGLRWVSPSNLVLVYIYLSKCQKFKKLLVFLIGPKVTKI